MYERLVSWDGHHGGGAVAGDVWFRLLGPVGMARGGEPIALGGTNRRTALAALLLRPNKVVACDELIDRIWGESPPVTARTQLQALIMHLRRIPHGPLIQRRAAGYLVEVDEATVDLPVFQGCLAEAGVATGRGEPAVTAQALRRALALWSGDALGGCADHLVERERPALQELRAAAVEDLADAELTCGRHRDVVGELWRAVEEEPLRERRHGQLMLALYRCGRQGEAMEVYRRLQARLADELGVAPGREIRECYDAIVRGDPVLDGAAAGVLASRSADASAGLAQLPAGPADFVGRSAELARLDALWAAADPGAPALVTITGTAGVGKTALALHWARRVAARFPGGQLHASLHGYAPGPPASPYLVLAGFLQALGVTPGAIPADTEGAAALYRSRLDGRRVLVVLDNAASADQVRPLIPGGGGCLVVVTSRDRLTGLVARDSARRLTLTVPPIGDAVALVGCILGEDRLRAQRDSVVALAEACGRLPLALRIAAADLVDRPSWTVADQVMALRGADPLGALVIENDPASAVRAAFDLSYAALAPAARRLFRLISQVPGADVTTADTAALAGIPDREARGLLRQLVNASLLDEHHTGRYRQHDLLRHYAAGQVIAEDARADVADALGRLLEHYLVTAEAAVHAIAPHMLRLPAPTRRVAAAPDPDMALSRLDADLDNLIAAVRQARAAGQARYAWLLADVLHGYFLLRRLPAQWVVVAEAGLAAADEAGDDLAQAACLRSLAHAHHRQGRYHEAVRYNEAALERARRCGWRDGEATILCNLGAVHWERGQPHHAADCFAGALAIHREVGPSERLAIDLGNLGLAHRQLGDLSSAVALYTEALDLQRSAGHLGGQAQSLTQLANVHLDSGRHDLAEVNLTEALRLYRQVGDRGGEANALDSIANAHLLARRFERADRAAQRALALAHDLSDHRTEADVYNTLGRIEAGKCQYDRAADLYTRALRLAEQTENRYTHTQSLLGLAATHLARGHRVEAVSIARQAEEEARTVGFRLLETEAHTILAGAADARRPPSMPAHQP